tara:strand:- start:23 stop:451 length:429 start_codon:yes stop_codon:yes gene_type:complete
MIISCEQCNKKFEVESNLIPSSGRLLQCSSCGYKWFFKKSISPTENDKTTKIQKNKEIKVKKIETKINKSDNEETGIRRNKDKNVGLLSIIIVFLISFTSLIVLLDTFKEPISNYFPDIDLFLNSLYESLKDLSLFIKDLLQ